VIIIERSTIENLNELLFIEVQAVVFSSPLKSKILSWMKLPISLKERIEIVDEMQYVIDVAPI
jgi:hypothetical protein